MTGYGLWWGISYGIFKDTGKQTDILYWHSFVCSSTKYSFHISHVTTIWSKQQLSDEEGKIDCPLKPWVTE